MLFILLPSYSKILVDTRPSPFRSARPVQMNEHAVLPLERVTYMNLSMHSFSARRSLLSVVCDDQILSSTATAQSLNDLGI